MRVVVQRVSTASVKINHIEGGTIGKGLVVLVGFEDGDTQDDLAWICRKLINLRIFDDEAGVMNHNIEQVQGSFLIVSQFTLHASTRKGNRPSYIKAAKPEIAIPLYEEFLNLLNAESTCSIETGKFGAYMEVQLVNDGPVTLTIDSKNKE